MTPQQAAAIIDHTLLKAEAPPEAIDRVCEEALQYGFASVCVNGVYTQRVAAKLKGSQVKTCVVAGFPLGASKPMIAAIEATSACKDGADEIDFVAHVPDLVAGDVDAAEANFREVVSAARTVNPNVVVKVILETAYLMDGVDAATADQRVATGCMAARRAGCDFVKTSTGFHPAGGATPEAVALLKKHAGPLKVKAAGGVRSLADAIKMVEAGADRLGCSAGVAIATDTSSDAAY